MEPLRSVSTSPGRRAWPLGMFSAMQAKAVTLTGSSSSAIATVAATMAAAPAMSSFIVCMEEPGLMESPPESKVMPLPTSARWPVAPGGSYVRLTSRGGASEPAPTPRMPPQRSLARRFSSQIVTLTVSPAWASIASANAGGRRSPGGVLVQSRAAFTARAIVVARSIARVAVTWRANGLSTTADLSLTSFLSFFFPLPRPDALYAS